MKNRLTKRAMWLAMLGAFLCAASYTFAASADAAHIEAEFVARPDGSQIIYYLDRLGRHPARKSLLVLIQGSDCNSVIYNPTIRRFANAYPEADRLMVEKYGIDEKLPYDLNVERSDCPASYLDNDNPRQRVQDLDRVISKLVATEGYEKVVTIGGSEGALIGNMLAARSANINATVAINGGGRWFLDDILYNIDTSESPAEEKTVSKQGIRGLFRAISENAKFNVAGSDHGQVWWKTVFAIDQQAELAATTTPVLVIQGGIDKSVSPFAANRLVDELRKSGHGNIEYQFYPELDHGLTNVEGVNQSAKVIGDIAEWLARVDKREHQKGSSN
nr:prolyl oligopeptidase family serine peptidase [Brucella intermedia]